MNLPKKTVYKKNRNCDNCPQIKQCPVTEYVRTGDLKCHFEKPLFLVEIEQPRPHLMVIPQDYEMWLGMLNNFIEERKQ